MDNCAVIQKSISIDKKFRKYSGLNHKNLSKKCCTSSMIAIFVKAFSNLSLKSSATKIGMSLCLTVGILVPTSALANESSTNIEGNRNPTAIAFTPDGQYAYVANNQASSNNSTNPGFLSRVGTADNSLLSNIPILPDPTNSNFKYANAAHVAIDPTGSFAYLPDGYGKFAVIDLSTNSYLTSFQPTDDSGSGGLNRVGGTGQIVFSPTKALAFVATRRSITIVETQSHTVIGAIDVQRFGAQTNIDRSDVNGITISGNGNVLFATEVNSTPEDTLQIFDISSLTALNPVATLSRAFPIQIADPNILVTNANVVVTGDLTTAYISTGYTRILLKMNLSNGALQELPVGLGVTQIAISSDRKSLVTSNSGDNTATIMDLTGQKQPRTVDVGGNPSAVAIAPNNKYALVANGDATSQTISKVQISVTPDAPRLVRGSSNQPTSVTLNFSSPTLNGEPVLSYEYSSDNGVTWLPVAPIVTSPPITIRGLNPGVTYRFRVRALSQSGAGSSSDEVIVSTVSLVHKLPRVPVKLKKGKSFTVGVKSFAGSFVTTTSLSKKVCSVTKTTKMVKQAGKTKKVKVTTGYKIQTKTLGTCRIKSSAPAIGYYPATQSIYTLQVTKK